MFLSSLTFLTPWAFVSLLILPLIWHLLKVTPPKPQHIHFPAVRLLQELTTQQVLATKTPWWMIVLRSLAILCLIAAFAQPVLNHSGTSNNADQPLVLLVDNDWSTMDRWTDRKKEIDLILDQAQRTNRPVMLIASANATNQYPDSFQAPKNVRENIANLTPQPWFTHRQLILEHLKKTLTPQENKPEIIWISNGLSEKDNSNFSQSLSRFGTTHIIRDSNDQLPTIIQNFTRTEQGFKLSLLNAKQYTTLQAIDEDAGLLHEQKVEANSNDIEISLPVELRSRIERIRILGANTPASQYLLDEHWRDRSVGLITHAPQNLSLLDPAYYIRKSLRPHAPLREDRLDLLLQNNVSVLFDTNETTLSYEDLNKIEDWILKGGVYISFASTLLAENADDYAQILPVQLSHAQRTIGGSLSWDQPNHLSEFPDHSPFAPIEIDKDIVAKKQILARPDANIANKTWAELADGTPLITAEQIGKGWSVLFHITAAPDWSNLPLSGNFELMMMRLLSLSNGSAQATPNQQALTPYKIFDSYGNLIPANGKAQAWTQSQRPSFTHLPGLYGTASNYRAVNLGPYIEKLTPINDLPDHVQERGFSKNAEIDLAPWALSMALLLALIDWFIAIGMTRFSKQAAMTGLFFGLLHFPTLAHSEEHDWDRLLAASNHMRLAYMITGNSQTDEISKRGLDSLGSILRRRTAVELASTMAFDPEQDDPSLFPMIYWPIEESQADLSRDASKRLNLFLKTGGFILFDTQGRPQQDQITRLTKQLDIGKLALVGDDHVLTRSFYLMQDFPGRFDNKNIWVEAHEDNKRDRVSSVIIGDNSWAQAWAKDDTLRPLYAVVPGGEIQREQAYRFGVNLVMYILSGNYKGDQVHLPAILQRLGL